LTFPAEFMADDLPYEAYHDGAPSTTGAPYSCSASSYPSAAHRTVRRPVVPFGRPLYRSAVHRIVRQSSVSFGSSLCSSASRHIVRQAAVPFGSSSYPSADRCTVRRPAVSFGKPSYPSADCRTVRQTVVSFGRPLLREAQQRIAPEWRAGSPPRLSFERNRPASFKAAARLKEAFPSDF
jgi:hypothetical protein